MSILGQLSNNLKKTAPPDTQNYLSKIHNKMINKVKSGSKKNGEILKAKKLEAFLNLIKNYQQNYKNNQNFSHISNNAFSQFWSIAEQKSLMEKIYSIHPEVITRLSLISGASSSFALGDQLETAIASIVKTMYSISQGASNPTEYVGNNYQSKTGSITFDVVAGVSKFSDINIEDTGMNIFKEHFTEIYNQISNEAKKYNQMEIGQGVKTMPSVAGKIDNVGLSANLQFSVQTKIEKDIIETLMGATFTDKNYFSLDVLHFGQTNPFRVFSVTAALYSTQDIIDRFYRMVECFESDSVQHPLSPTYFYRIRAIYELTGAGMTYSNIENNVLKNLLNVGTAKYLIWNNVLGKISVIPTSRIVDSIIEKESELMPSDWKDAMFGPIEIKQKALDAL